VGGEDRQHGGQRRGEHARSFSHAADGVAAAAAEGDFGDGVCGADSVGRVEAAVARRLRHCGVHSGKEFRHGQAFPDETGGADHDPVRGVVERCGQVFRGGARVLEARGPGAGVGAPELRTTARTWPSATACWDHCTGAALPRFFVKTAAAEWCGPSLMTTATSRWPPSLMPAATPAARKPKGAVTLTVPLQS